jgi:hypothetical protein
MIAGTKKAVQWITSVPVQRYEVPKPFTQWMASGSLPSNTSCHGVLAKSLLKNITTSLSFQITYPALGDTFL